MIVRNIITNLDILLFGKIPIGNTFLSFLVEFYRENNEIMISITESGLGVNDAEGWIYEVELPYFDISSYSNINSVVMAVNNITTYDWRGIDVIGEGNYELYDITNDKPIENSIVTSDDIAENTYKSSANFISSLPRSKIKLGIKLYSGGNFTASCSHVYLILSK